MNNEHYKNLYLMRHGETLFNRRNLIQGVVNSPLLAEGVAQAMHTRKCYFDAEQIQIDHLFCSPEGRAIQTAEIVSDLPYVTVKNLHEMSFGRLEGCPCYVGCPKNQFPTYYGTIGGETLKQVETRMNQALTEIMDMPENQNVLVVAHGCANQAFMDLWQPYDQTKPDALLHNCSVLHYAYDPEKKVFLLQDLFNEEFQTEDLKAAIESGQAFVFPFVTPDDFC